MTFRELSLDIRYSGRGNKILTNFVLPVLEHSREYDRVTSFFSTNSLVAIAEGLDGLWKRQGKMRLIMGLHDVPADLAEAARQSDDSAAEVISLVRQRIVEGIANIRDEMIADRLTTVAWMIQDGLLEIKVAAPKPIHLGPPGIFHNKQLIFKDVTGEIVAAVGSPNETAAALGNNNEHLTVFTSWEQPRYTESEVSYYEALWGDQDMNLSVRDLDSSFAEEILGNLPNRSPRRSSPIETPRTVRDIFEVALKMPAFAMLSGGHTALFPHQELVYLEALSRWPVRAMLADEVGLGKTFEAGAVIRFLVQHSGISSVVILAPKAVLYQWQAELNEHFGLDAAVYDSARRAFVSVRTGVKFLDRGQPIIGPSTPQIVIVSAQLARGTRSGGHIFDDATMQPELLVVDEVHSARVKPDLAGDERPTLMWRMLNDIVGKIPHVLFATATPMQMHWREYHALLSLLGLPPEWDKSENYHRSLSLVTGTDAPDLSEAALTYTLIRSSLINFEPEHLELEPSEHDLASRLSEEPDPVTGSFLVRDNWELARSLFIKVHPARFLTIRNTRSALEQIGYTFPSRNFPAYTLENSDDVRIFYQNIDNYLSNGYFELERALYPGRTFAVGFVKCAYQQRLASSLHACRLSLSRRRERISLVESEIGSDYRIDEVLEELNESDVFETDDTETTQKSATQSNISVSARTAAMLEKSFIDDLIDSVDRILIEQADPKILGTLELLRTHMDRGHKVLVFSRYTDTIDAVVGALHECDLFVSTPTYAIYTGQRAETNLGLGAKRSTRQDIKSALDEGVIRVVFCSDAASEGLNLQAAQVIINIDVPWNPARLEQRIGRIARLGQRADTVEIYNLWYPESIEAKMYTRLLSRRDLFELAVGEFPEVIGKAIREELATRFGAVSTVRDPISQLNQLKNDLQVRALRQLWDRKVPARTLSAKFRSELGSLAVLAARFVGATVTEDDSGFIVSKGNHKLRFTIEPGGDDVISFTHPLLQWLMSSQIKPSSNLHVASENGVPMFFAFEDRLIDPQSFPSLINEMLVVMLSHDTPAATECSTDSAGKLSSPWLPSPFRLTIPGDNNTAGNPSLTSNLSAMTFAPLSND
jgi:superfamily II DNA or RNA helicase